MKKIAVLGYGVVGSGVVELFYRNQKKIEKNTGTELEVGYILDLREFPDDPYGQPGIRLCTPLSGGRQERCHFQQAAGCRKRRHPAPGGKGASRELLL